MIKLKICGMRDPANINEVAALRPDYMGFIFFNGSKRYVGDLPGEVIKNLPSPIKKTGVFVDAPIKEVLNKIGFYGLDAVQLHGKESAEYSAKLLGRGVEVIRAFGISELFDFEQLSEYENSVDFFLFDTQTPGHGGSGKTFRWDLLKNYKLNKPYFLSGGIGLEELNKLKEISDKRLYAVDVNSRFETEPGLKDIKRLKEIRL